LPQRQKNNLRGKESNSMRQLGTLTDERAAQRFADFLLTKGMAVSLEPNHDGCRIWVRNEDHLEPARREFAEFTAQPDAPIYREAGRLAEELRAEERRRVQQARKNFVDVSTRWRRGLVRRAPVTLLLIAASVAVALMTNLGNNLSACADFAIVHYNVQGQIITWVPHSTNWLRQPWRLVTPIFVHFGIWHILFNMMWLFQLGVLTEGLRGSLRFLVFVLLIAVFSNLAQYYWGGSGPRFGGMSGVVYGIFGYVWMKSRYEPASGFFLPPNTVFWMLGWFVLCATGWIGPIANFAHGGGLVVGIILGRWSSLWRALRRSASRGR
jgi:GlpG protein